MSCSESTIRRALETLQDTLGAPVEIDRQFNGHHYNQTQAGMYELPGLWLNQQGLYALLVSSDLLANLQPNILRTFSLDRLQPIVVLESKAEDIREDELEKHYVDAYGIFAGVAENLAILLFSAEAARWVADEQWHPKQVGKILKNGSYELKIPYGDARELIMEILKYGDDVEIIDPPELRSLLIDKLQRTLSQYKGK